MLVRVGGFGANGASWCECASWCEWSSWFEWASWYEWCELAYFDLYDFRNKVKVNFTISFRIGKSYHRELVP